MSQYLLFFAQIATVLAALLIVIGRLAWLARNAAAADGADRIRVRRLNDRFRTLERAVREATLAKKPFKAWHKADQKAEAARLAAESAGTARKRLYVLDFRGDIRASAVAGLRDEVTAVLAVARATDEVVVRLESPGGLVHAYGLAASQLARLRERSIPLTAVVDKVAASGGYMMACVADKVVAAPFAVLGSIGVVAQIPNVHRLLEKHGVDFELLTAGEHKRTLTVFGENTDKGRQKAQEELDDAHALFKDFIAQYRPQVDLARVATGEHWYGVRARDLGLCDELRTSDDYLLEASRGADLFEVKCTPKQALGNRLVAFAAALVEAGIDVVARGSRAPAN
ncbi:MAG: protease SohB [Myxococcales bacterium]|nr:protease SohB [Myxococcales bacterium]